MGLGRGVLGAALQALGIGSRPWGGKQRRELGLNWGVDEPWDLFSDADQFGTRAVK